MLFQSNQNIERRPRDCEAEVGRRVVFVGNPNCGKTTLFNRLTGMRAKTANFPGTTVELRRAVRMEGGALVEYVDLPGLYGLAGGTPEEAAAASYLRDVSRDPAIRTLAVVVLDATRLTRNLSLVRDVREAFPEMLVVLNMSDLAKRRGLEFETEGIAREIGAPVVEVSARTGGGVLRVQAYLTGWFRGERLSGDEEPPCLRACKQCSGCPYQARFQWAENLNARVSRRTVVPSGGTRNTDRMDAWVTHPVTGMFIFIAVMAVLFQGLFWLAEAPMGWIDNGFTHLREAMAILLPEGILNRFLVDGLLAGIAGALIFLPQICILFFLISLLEDTGYLARAAFIADRLMAMVGLPGKAFIPILSAHACAIPAIMSARMIENPRDRLATMLVLPLFTCAARIPVYVMVTAMLFQDSPGKAGLVFTGAYFLGIAAAFGSAFVLKGSLLKGEASPLLIELPDYRIPSLRTALVTMIDRGRLFLIRAGTVITAVIVVLWCLAQFPVLPEDRYPENTIASFGASGFSHEGLPDSDSAVSERRSGDIALVESPGPNADRSAELARERLEYSMVGRMGKAIQPVFAPLGFDWQISVGIITSFAAREVVASTLAVLYGLSDDAETESVAARLRTNVPPAAGLSLLVFFVLAMQCLPTQIVTRRESGSWKWPIAQIAYMSTLAYTAAWLTYQIASRTMG